MNTYEYSVIPENIDSCGKMTIPSICRNVINAIGQNIAKEGYGIDVMLAKNISWILVRSAFEIDVRPSLYSSYHINVWPASCSGVVHSRCVSILDSEGLELGRGITEWCIMDVETRRPLFPELDMKNAFAEAPCRNPRRMRDWTPEQPSTRMVYNSDCDYNNHMTNMRYVDMFYDMLPDDIVNLSTPVRLDVNYRHEARCGASISTGIRTEADNEWLFIAKDRDQTLCTASLIRT